MSGITVRVEEVTGEDRRAIIDGLVAYNHGQGFVSERQPLAVVSRGPGAEVVGGLLGEVNHGWLFVSALWVADHVRGTGIGSDIVREAEAEARRRGCRGVYLDTYSFQARPFYEKLGYRVFGELADCPPGGTRYYLCKRLT